MEFIHAESAPCAISQLELFGANATCVQVKRSKDVPHFSVNAVTNETNMLEFLIQGSGEQYLDLMKMKLYLKCTITYDDAKLTAGAQIAPAANLLGTMFSQCDVFLNDKMVTSSNNLYAQRAYIESMVNYQPQVGSHQLSSQMYYPDTEGAHDSATGNKGFTWRQYFTSESREFEMCGAVSVDISNQSRYMLNNIDIRVRLSRSPNKFCLMDFTTTPKAKLNIKQAILQIPKVDLDKEAQLGIESQLRLHKRNAIYNILRQEPKMFTIGSGNSSFTREHISLGQTPKYSIIGLLGTEAQQGSYTKSPFKFDHFNVKQISLNVDGEQIPQNGINVSFNDSEPHNCMEGYMSMLNVTRKFKSDSAYAHSYIEYMKGNILYGFEIAPEVMPGMFNLVRQSSIRLDIQFAKALTRNIAVMMFFFYDGTVEVNANQQIYVEHVN